MVDEGLFSFHSWMGVAKGIIRVDYLFWVLALWS